MGLLCPLRCVCSLWCYNTHGQIKAWGLEWLMDRLNLDPDFLKEKCDNPPKNQ